MNKRQWGKIKEDKACEYLQQQGYKILSRNFYTYFGEIDIIALDGEEIVFLEVKYRKNSRQGYPEEAVTGWKQRRIYKSAEYYLYQTGKNHCKCRFDVLAILDEDITHIKDAFSV